MYVKKSIQYLSTALCNAFTKCLIEETNFTDKEFIE